jgi:threonine/homoserine/homoserine lactone efflux protein
LQAYLLASVARRGWRRTLPAACAPLVSDGPIALLVLLVLDRLPEGFARWLQAAGGVLLLWLAWAGYRQWRRQAAAAAPVEPGSAPRTILQGALVNLLNPNPYLGWSLVLGPAVVNAWRVRPADGVAVVIAFYAVLVTTLAGTIVLFGTTRILGPRGRRLLILVSALVLAALGAYNLASGLR